MDDAGLSGRCALPVAAACVYTSRAFFLCATDDVGRSSLIEYVKKVSTATRSGSPGRTVLRRRGIAAYGDRSRRTELWALSDGPPRRGPERGVARRDRWVAAVGGRTGVPQAAMSGQRPELPGPGDGLRSPRRSALADGERAEQPRRDARSPRADQRGRLPHLRGGWQCIAAPGRATATQPGARRERAPRAWRAPSPPPDARRAGVGSHALAGARSATRELRCRRRSLRARPPGRRRHRCWTRRPRRTNTSGSARRPSSRRPRRRGPRPCCRGADPGTACARRQR